MEKQSLRNLLSSPSKKSVLVIGDIILDKFIWGSVDRISPEAPVQVVNIQREDIALGGAANVAHNLAAMDCRVTILGVIGRDENGKTVEAELDRIGINKSGLFTDPKRPTTTKTRVMAANQQVVRIDHEITDAIPEQIENQILEYLKNNILNFAAVIISDYQKGVLTDNIISHALKLSKQKNVKTIVDPKRNDFSVYSGASIIKPNLKEAEAAVNKKLKTDKDILDAGKSILENCGCEAVLITRGKEGMLLIEKTGVEKISSTAQEVFDVTGAGDTVIAYLGMLLANGHSYSEAAGIANIAAGVAVRRVGTATVTKDDVLHEMEEISSGSNKIMTADELNAALSVIRKNKKIVFTNGCFDILHIGHIALLKKSKALGDKLIVGLNSDASIRRIKGKNRPIVSENERAHILAALESVDYVVLFDDDTPLELIKQLKPDILVKGSDYKIGDVVGHEVVESYGGKVELVDLVEGFSSTRIVESILKNHASSEKKN